MRLQGLIFDMDGTLGDTLAICVEGLRRAAEPIAGRRYTDHEIAATFGPSEEGSVRVLAPADPERCLDDYIRHYEELHVTCPTPFEGIPELLHDLKAAGVRLGIVTGKGPRSLEVSLRCYGIADVFDEIRAGCPDRPCKPQGIKELATRWALANDQVGYLGDVPKDVHSAREAGVLALSAAWATTADFESLRAAEPDALFKTVEELRAWMKVGR